MNWQELKKNHAAMMALCCAIPLLLVAALFWFGFDVKSYSWAILLLCPLVMAWMMKDMHETKRVPSGKKACH